MRHRVIFSLLLIFVILLVNPVDTAADQQYAGRMAVVLVIDGSGSMVHNDPDRVRVEAARKAVDILKDGDYLAAVEFSTEARLLVRMREVGGEAERREINALIDQAGQQGDTDILSGLRAAFHQFAGAPADARKFVILLSDGESDVPGVTGSVSTRERYFAETETLLERYREQGWAVHCIAFHEEGAGAELQNIAQKTGGEYQFVTSTDQLKNIFANILLAAKYPPGVQPEFRAALTKQNDYCTGDILQAEACLMIGEDQVLPGPYLSLKSMELVVTAEDKVLAVPFVEGGDGRYRAEIKLNAPGEYEVGATVTADYRGVPVAESLVLDWLVVTENQGALWRLKAEAGQWTALLGAAAERLYAAVLYAIAPLLVLLLLVRLHRRDRVKGELSASTGTGTEVRYAKYRFRLGKAGKREIRIGTAKNRETSFTLEPIEREFAFLIRSVRDPYQDPNNGRLRRLLYGPKMVYEVVCLPGTVMQIGERLKTRDFLYDGDVFEIGGYVFELKSSAVEKRPRGENVLETYHSTIDPPVPGKKILTLRVINREDGS